MRIMTFNTQHCGSYLDGLRIDYRLFAEAIRGVGADVVGLNEIRGNGRDNGYDAQTDILADLAGYPYHHFSEAIRFQGTNPYGNGLLSRKKIVKLETYPILEPKIKCGNEWYEDRVLTKATLECGLTVMTVHVGLNRDEKEIAVKTILENIECEKCVLMGDFNMDPDDPLIDKIREKLRDTGMGLDEKTFPSDAPMRRIDYIFVSPDIKVLCTETPALVVSDHLPYVVEIELI